MALFRRRARRADPAAGVAAFWSWWAEEGARRTAAALAEGSLERWARTLGAQVDAVDDRLAWELGPGRRSEHVLVVTSGGEPELRGTARRWRQAAPEPDATWEYSDVRLRTEGLGWSLQLAGADIGADDVVVGARVDADRSCVDVSVHHPAFASLPQAARDQCAFLLLDTALGEEAVETWVGEVVSTTSRPPDPVDLLGLQHAVDELARSCTEDDGSPTWTLLSATTDSGSPVLALAQVPLRSATAPHLDTHVGLRLAFAEVLDSGQPGAGSLSRLRALEDHLGARLGGSGRVVAHETADGVRELHLYVDGTTPAVEQVRAALGGWTESEPQVRSGPDPAWAEVRHLRG